jgi:uncharacterized protein YxjI
MRFVMRQKWLALGDDFSIKAEDGTQPYFVDGRAFSWGHKLSMTNATGQEVAFIAQKLLAWAPVYEIHRNGNLFAIVKKELFTFFKCRFTVDVPGPNDYEATGDFLDREYAFFRTGRPVATVSKRFFSLTDTYGIDIANGEDEVTLLAACVVIDLCCHADKKH